MKRSLILALCVGLAAVYAYVAYAVFNPRVSEDYVAYYVTRESDLTPGERSRLAAVEPGAVYRHDETAALHFSRGWSRPEAEHRWTDGSAAIVAFRAGNASAAAFQGRITLQAGTLGRQRLNIRLNENQVFDGEVTLGSDGVLSFGFDPATLREDGVNLLRFALPDARRPDNGDERRLAVALRALSFE